MIQSNLDSIMRCLLQLTNTVREGLFYFVCGEVTGTQLKSCTRSVVDMTLMVIFDVLKCNKCQSLQSCLYKECLYVQLHFTKGKEIWSFLQYWRHRIVAVSYRCLSRSWRCIDRRILEYASLDWILFCILYFLSLKKERPDLSCFVSCLL